MTCNYIIMQPESLSAVYGLLVNYSVYDVTIMFEHFTALIMVIISVYFDPTRMEPTKHEYSGCQMRLRFLTIN